MYYVNSIIEMANNYRFEVKLNENMSRHTTFKIGGNAEVFITVCHIEGLIDIISRCQANEVPYMVIGKGSNLLVSDKGIDGVVIRLDGDFNRIKLIDEETIYCGAGVSMAKLCNFACEKGLSGLEFAWGIPGSAGGAVYMNAGAYGGEMKDVVVSAEHIDSDNNIGTFNLEQLNLGYRHSIYTDNGYIITGVILHLHRDSQVEIRKRMDDYMNRRKSKQPVEYPSAGSVFKRPEGNFAGTLIEQAGLKGKTIGGAKVSEKHAGFIINTGNATCKDVKNLVRYIQNTVKNRSGIELECEIKMVGR